MTVVLLLAAFSLFFRFSLLGTAMRATADNQQVAQSLGVSVKGIFALSWCIATVVSALGGIILGSVRGGVDFSLADYGLKIFPVVILGGLDSVAGVLIGGIMIGVLENLSGGYLDPVFGGGREGGRAVRRAGGDPHDPALRAVRPGRRGARLMQCGDFRVSYAADERIFETRLPIVGRGGAPGGAGLRAAVRRDVLARRPEQDRHRHHRRRRAQYPGRLHRADLHRPRRLPGRRRLRHRNSRSKAGLPFWLAIPLAAALTSVFGLVFGVPSLRLKGLYLAIATLAAHFITTYGIIHWEKMTNGVLGFNVTPATVFGSPSTPTSGSST